MVVAAVVVVRGSLARSLHICKLAFQSCRYMASRAENIHVFLIRGTKKINNTPAVLAELAFQS